jgi:hypothetical protein
MNQRTAFMLTSVAIVGYAIAGFPEIGFAPAWGQDVTPRVGPASSNPPASPTSKNSNPPSLRETSRTSSGEPDFQPVLRHDPLRTSWHALIQGKAIE